MSSAFSNPEVQAVFLGFDRSVRPGLLLLREVIFEEAASLPEVGSIEECLKWGQPSYLTPVSGSGTTIRLGVPKEGGFALYVHCQTTLISDFLALFPDEFTVEKKRAIRFQKAPSTRELEMIRVLIRAALTYHLPESDKKL